MVTVVVVLHLADDITTGDAEVEISTTSGQITINNAHSDSDIVFKGNDGGSAITALTLICLIMVNEYLNLILQVQMVNLIYIFWH